MKGIYIKDMGFAYSRGPSVFRDFSLSLETETDAGRITVVMGPSGSGKSTLLKILLGIEKIQTGTMRMHPEVPVTSYVPQEPVLFEHLSPEKNARYFQFAGAFQDRFNESLYKELIGDLGLGEVLSRAKSVNEISGGQRQRLSLLRALSINPDFLLLDEPCNGLDAEVQLAFLNKLREITGRHRLFVLYITHHKLEAMLMADDVVYLLQDGNGGIVSKAFQAPVLTFINEPPVLEAAGVFRFPETKILPVAATQEGGNQEVNEVLSKNQSGFILFREQNIKLDGKQGMPFTVVAKSPVYSILRHKILDIELMIGSELLSTYGAGDTVHLQLDGKVLIYDAEKVLKNSAHLSRA